MQPLFIHPYHKISRVRSFGCRSEKRLLILFLNPDPFVYCLTEFLIDLRLISSMNTTQHQSRTDPNITSTFLRPFDKVHVLITRFHVSPPQGLSSPPVLVWLGPPSTSPQSSSSSSPIPLHGFDNIFFCQSGCQDRSFWMIPVVNCRLRRSNFFLRASFTT